MSYSPNQNLPSPTVYGFNFYNKNSTVDKTMLSCSMWKTTIRISIFPLIESENDDQVKYDRKGGISIYLTPYKAYMFAELLKKFKEDPETCTNRGIPSGLALISVEDPRFAPGYKRPDANTLISIRKVNPEGGVDASYAYELNRETDGIVKDYNQETGQFSKDYEMMKGTELELLIIQLETYCRAMTNSTAFSVIEQQYPYLDKIANKLGVELMTNYGSSYKSNSYFNSSPSNDGGSTSTMGGTSSLASMI